jgi:hypothetical protein
MLADGWSGAVEGDPVKFTSAPFNWMRGGAARFRGFKYAAVNSGSGGREADFSTARLTDA